MSWEGAPAGLRAAPAHEGRDGAWQPAQRGWYPAVLVGTLPPLLLGFVASVLANRLAFAGWALVGALGHLLLLRAAWGRGWRARARAALVLAWAALAVLVLAGLVQRHQEILDLGYRALLWPLYAAWPARAVSWRALAATLAVAAALLALLARKREEGR